MVEEVDLVIYCVGSRLFLDTCREVMREYPEVDVDDYHIDTMTAHLVRRMKDFDVIVTENMFGDILSDLAGELVGKFRSCTFN
jgi:3-isopropylmalate dehydrogenase